MVGVCCALALQKRGFAVTLLDRREPGSETSYGNAGIVSGSSILPLNNPGLWKALPSYLGNRHAAVRYRLGDLIANPGWVLRFLAQALPSRLPARVTALGSLTSRSLPLHRELMREAGVSHRLRETGFIKLFRTQDGAARAAAEHAWFEDHGIRTQVLDRQALSALEPDLNPIFPAAIWHPDSGSVDRPQAVVQAYAALFVARGGTIRQAEVRDLRKHAPGWVAETTGGDIAADLAVVALGPWSGSFLAGLGLTVPLGVERGYHRHFRPEEGRRLHHPVHDTDAAYMLAPMEQGLRLTSGVELADRDAPDDHAQIDQVEPRLREAFPIAGRAEETTWRGARPTLPDSLPMIGPAPGKPGLWLAFGNQHIGFSTGPVTGEILAAMVAGEAPPADPAPFAPTRYLRG